MSRNTHDALADEDVSQRKQYLARSKRTTPTCAAVADPAEVVPATPSVSPSLQQPELQEPLPSPTLQQLHKALPSDPALQPQQITSVLSHQRPPVHLPLPHLTTAPSPGPSPGDSDVQELSPSLPAAPPPSPHLDSPRPRTSNPTLRAVLATVDPNRSECVPPPAEAFTFANVPSFITPAAIQYLQSVSAGQRWVEMITAYLRFEELPVAKAVCIFCASNLSIALTNNMASPPLAFPLGFGQVRFPNG